jgi:hypothetical protein
MALLALSKADTTGLLAVAMGLLVSTGKAKDSLVALGLEAASVNLAEVTEKPTSPAYVHVLLGVKVAV